MADRRARMRWWWALLATLVWHLFALGLLAWWAPWSDLVLDHESYEPIEMVFAPPPKSSEEDRATPREFTELPEDRVDLRPDDPDFLSNVDSRERDRATADEQTELPRLEGESEAPHLGLSPDQPTPPENVEGSGRPEATAEDGRDEEIERPSDAVESGGASELLEEQPVAPRDGRRGRPGPESPRAGTSFPSVPPLPHKVGPALSDIRQEEMSNPLGNVPLFGDVSMNTVAWPWAAWMQQFQRNFLRGWINFVPYAYRIGVIDGRQVIRLEIDPDGTLLGIEVLEREGHASLEEASLANLKSFAPYGPLSEDGSFPEPTLKLQLTIIYPDF